MLNPVPVPDELRPTRQRRARPLQKARRLAPSRSVQLHAEGNIFNHPNFSQRDTSPVYESRF